MNGKMPGMKILAQVLYLLLFTPLLLAQTNIELSKETLSSGILLEFKGAEISSNMDFLVIKDSDNHDLAIQTVNLNGSQLWIQNSPEEATVQKTINWHFDKLANRLVVDLGSIKRELLDQSTLIITLTILNTRVKKFDLSVYQANKAELSQPQNELQILRNINIEVKNG